MSSQESNQSRQPRPPRQLRRPRPIRQPAGVRDGLELSSGAAIYEAQRREALETAFEENASFFEQGPPGFSGRGLENSSSRGLGRTNSRGRDASRDIQRDRRRRQSTPRTFGRSSRSVETQPNESGGEYLRGGELRRNILSLRGELARHAGRYHHRGDPRDMPAFAEHRAQGSLPSMPGFINGYEYQVPPFRSDHRAGAVGRTLSSPRVAEALPLPDTFAGMADAEGMVAAFTGLLGQQITLVAAALSGLRTEVLVTDGEEDNMTGDLTRADTSQAASGEAAVPVADAGAFAASATDMASGFPEDPAREGAEVDIIPLHWLEDADAVDPEDYGAALRQLFDGESTQAASPIVSAAGEDAGGEAPLDLSAPMLESRAARVVAVNESVVGDWIAGAPSYVIDGYLRFIRDQFKCPVCLEWMAPDFLECRNGHVICGPCSLRCHRCPMCRDFGGYRHVVCIERNMAGLCFPCRHRGDDGEPGCQEFLAAAVWRRHADYHCPYRPTDIANMYYMPQ